MVNREFKMANIKTIILFSVCIFFVIAALEFVVSEARRSGGRYGGSRYGGTRTRVRYGSSRTRVRYGTGTRTRVRYSGSRSRVRYGGTRVRIRAGSSPYTRSTFSRALMLGYLYGSLRYMRTPRYIRYPDRMPTICTNNYDSDSNGTVYGYFICPRMGEPEKYEYCCGDNHRERCCEYFDEDDKGRTAGIVVGVIILIIIIGIIMYCVCKRTGAGGQVVKKFSSKKHDHGPVNMVPVPTQPSEKNHPGSYPPPDSYNYSNPSNQYTPQPEKPPMPQADFNNGGQPYPPYNSSPYPQGNQGAYPPGPDQYPGNQPFSNPSPYPPSPYPNTDGYQQPGNSPYPPDNHPAPYNSNPYPPPQGYDDKGPGYPNSPPPPYPQ